MITGVLIDKLPGPRRDIVVMNAAAGLVVAGKVETFAEGTVRAKLAIDSGGVHQIIEKLRGSLR
jgi:anthranilate phosphoribosyltransferase